MTETLPQPILSVAGKHYLHQHPVQETIPAEPEAIATNAVEGDEAVKAGRTIPKWEAETRERLTAAIAKFTKPLADLKARDANEGDTRLLVTDFLCEGLGYDKYADLTTEYMVRGTFADYGVRPDGDLLAFIEVKRIATKLGEKHLRQVQMYGVNEGVEWLLLTNGAVWSAYHLGISIPVELDHVFTVDLLDATQSVEEKVDLLFHLSRSAMKRETIAEFFKTQSARSPKSISAALLTPTVLDALRKEVRRATGNNIPVEELAHLVTTTVLRDGCI